MMLVCRYFLCFVFYSFLGWCCESVYCSIAQGKLVNRGFLNGPLCPVYGFGALLVILLLRGTEQNVAALFFSGMLVTSVLEYLTSWLLEKLFHMRWWDYSHYKFQINGRVCLLNSMMFGGLSVILMLVLRPFTERVVDALSPVAAGLLTGLLAGLILADIFVTVRDLLRMKGHLEELENRLAELKAYGDEKALLLQQELGERRDDLLARKEAASEEWKKAVADLRQKLENEPGHQKWVPRRIVRAFPGLRSRRYEEAMEQLREHLSVRKKKGDGSNE